MADPISKCPQCGNPLEATVKVHLSNVVVHDGLIVSYSPAFGDSIDASLQMYEDVHIYCGQDHEFDDE